MNVTYREVKALLRKDYTRSVPIHPPKILRFHRITLTPDGILKIERGYAWDHASGAFDTKTIIEGALVHDALCELIHNKLLGDHVWPMAAEVMYDININSKPRMWKPRAKWVRRAILVAGVNVTESRKWRTA